MSISNAERFGDMSKIALMAVAAAACFCGVAQAATPYDAAVEANNPLAYYNLVNSNATTTTDAVNGYTMTLQNGATVQAGAGPTINGSAVPGLVLGGTAYAGSGGAKPEIGGISSAGTILAWINLAALPSTDGRIFSIAGSSAVGDDFDLQIDTDDKIDFYTDGGSSTETATTLNSSDLGKWIFVAATFTAGTDRNVYLDGSLNASSTPGGHYDSNNPFYIGQSNVFGGRYFDGSIADVAFYNTDLTAAQISTIYNSASIVASATPEPGSWALMILGLAGVGGMLRRNRKTESPAAAGAASA